MKTSAPFGSLCRFVLQDGLTLRELEAGASTTLTGFLTFFHAGIAGQAASLLEHFTIGSIQCAESAGECVTHCASLTCDAAALSGDEHVILADEVGHSERLVDVSAERFAGDVTLSSNAIDGPLAFASDQTDVSDCGFTATGTFGEFVSPL